MNFDELEYRPQVIEFDVASDGSCMPLSLGEYKTLEDVNKFVAYNFTAVNQAVTTARHMDQKEKRDLRDQYEDALENQLPRYEKAHAIAAQALNEAKKNEKDAGERVSACLTEVKILSREVKRGLKDIKLDDISTVRVPYKGRYYYYTYMDGRLKLCLIQDIPEHEKTEIWNVMAANEEFFDTNFGHGETETQEREEE
jgi:hypothetical protein